MLVLMNDLYIFLSLIGSSVNGAYINNAVCIPVLISLYTHVYIRILDGMNAR